MAIENVVTPEILLERINRWQRNPVFHPLTCETDSRHALLNGKIEDGKLELYCPDCAYVQENVPKLFHSPEYDQLYAEQQKILDIMNLKPSE